jgi:glycosyltransferase involved in cell wall biosynthesis
VKILHITTHLGGGVGKALSSIVTYERKNNPRHFHKILLLDDPEKDQFINICRKGGVEVLLKGEPYNLNQELANADIVILHWWHHPAMALLLANFPKLPLRLILWAHVNGCNYPCLPFEFVALPQKTFLTSPFSLENASWSKRQREKIKKYSTVVYGLGEVEYYSKIKKVHSNKFIVGYIGTLSSSKLHPQFVDFCYAALKKVPNTCFVMVGDVNHGNDILQKAKAYRIDNRFKLIGYSNQIVNELSKFDVFAYPLNPKHFGTTENVLLEAMALGLPVVALNHNTEKYIISNHKEVGLLADNIEHYADCIKYLHDNPRERTRIGVNARKHIKENFTFEKNIGLMRRELNKVVKMPRKRFDFKNVFGAQPYEWFLACLGEDRAPFAASIDKKLNSSRKKAIEQKIKTSSLILREKKKSSIAHFAESFPEDANLQYWKGLLVRLVRHRS